MSDDRPDPAAHPLLWGITRNILVAGVVSFLMDVSSEMVYAITPLFLVSLGAGGTTVGLIEGIAEATAAVFKLLSGVFADRFQRYKPLVTIGYLVSALSRPILATATTAHHVLAGRIADRFGKGVRTAPRDAIIAASAQRQSLGKSFGFHRAMDQAGAILGPALAFYVLYRLHGAAAHLKPENFRSIIWISIIPALLAVSATFLLVETGRRRKDSLQPVPADSAQPHPDVHPSGHAAARYFFFLAVMLIFSIGNSSNAFLFLRAADLGLAAPLIPLAYAGMNVTYTAVAVPWGVLADRVGFRRVILVGFAVYVLVYLWLAAADAAWMIWPIFACYGLFESAFEGQSRAYLARLTKRHLHGTAFGLYHALLAVSILIASVVAGLLYDRVSHAAPFYFAALMAALAFCLLAAEPFIFPAETTESPAD